MSLFTSVQCSTSIESDRSRRKPPEMLSTDRMTEYSTMIATKSDSVRLNDSQLEYSTDGRRSVSVFLMNIISLYRDQKLFSTRYNRPQRFSLTVLVTLSLILLSAPFGECVVKIHGMRVPEYVENGNRSVVLDCLYTLDPEEDLNLVVKWFLNEDPEPIYQWIAELDTIHVPQRYEGKVNTNYRVPPSKVPASGYRWQKRRALNLIRPTVQFNGKYACHVMSLHSQASAEANMIVYAKTKQIDLQTRRVVRERSTALHQTTGNSMLNTGAHSPSGSSGSAALSSNSWLYGDAKATSPPSSAPPIPRLSSASSTEIQCSVDNVYPVPELTIYQVSKDGRPRSLQNARFAQNLTRLPNGAFGVTLTAFVEDAELLKSSGAHDLESLGGLNTHKYHHPAVSASRTNHRNHGNGNRHHQETIFECLVSQEEIHHEVRKQTIYLPLKDEQDFETGSGCLRSLPLSIELFYLLVACSLASIRLLRASLLQL